MAQGTQDDAVAVTAGTLRALAAEAAGKSKVLGLAVVYVSICS